MRRRILYPVIALAAAGAIAGCGSSSKSNSTASTPATTSPATTSTPKVGGSVTVLDVAGGVDSLDPGYWYYQTDYTELYRTTQRGLYQFTDSGTAVTPDLATALPVVTNGGKTVTITIKSGIKYSPPLQNETVASSDIKYALERCFLASVGNGYAESYFNDIVGAPKAPTSKLDDIAGIQAPNPTTLVINTTVPVGVLTTGEALGLPCSVPVPQAYAAKYDSAATSTYGMHQVGTGPYMIEGAGTGTVPASGYTPQKSLVLVRNPSFEPSTDTLVHGYLDKIVFSEGNDITEASSSILQNPGLISGDWAAPPTAVLQKAVQHYPQDISLTPAGSLRYISLNTTIPPLNNVDFRRAINAIVDRNALRLTRGGPEIGTIATHILPPAMGGFAQAGGDAGPGYDFVSNPNGSLATAEKYMKLAGYPSGKYTGPPLLAIADNSPPASDTAQAFEQEVSQIGIRLTFREVPHSTMLSKYCEVPKAKVAICPSLGWGKDFFDSQSFISPMFYGPNIVPTGNPNFAQVNNPTINAQINTAISVLNPTARASAFAKLDDEITDQAYYVPWLWDTEVIMHSSNVVDPPWVFNGGDSDLANAYLK
jgi:peptide/nickel transport system substrate-binding protein